MSKKLSVVIMAHPKRENLIPYLKEKLGNVPVVWDKKNNLWDTCRRAWLAQDMSCEYSVVIQDDALVTSNFIEKAEAVIGQDRIYSFYLSSLLINVVKTAKQKGESYISNGMIFNEVAICIPTKYINEMVDFCDEHLATNDQYIWQWAKSRSKKIFYPIPSLVSHRDNIESIYRLNNDKPQPTKPRVAIEFYE